MSYYAVIDTNVLVSNFLTLNPNSPIKKIMNYIGLGQIIPMFNDEILSEYTEVLHRKNFGLNDESVNELLESIKKKGISCDRKEMDDIFPDPDDVVFYEVAMSREDSYLVTGNLKHFPKNGRVVSPSEMLQIIELGNLPKGLLNASEGPEYMSMTLDEINVIIHQVRKQMAERG